MQEVILPSFIKDVDYKEFSIKENTGKYRFLTLNSITICFKNKSLLPKHYKLQFNDQDGTKRMVITRYSITIFKGYAWDGCSPKWRLFNKWIGTPDFPETILASLIHDALRQFESTEYFPFSRDYQDDIFFYILKESNFKWASVYLMGVNIGSVILPKSQNSSLSSLKINIID